MTLFRHLLFLMVLAPVSFAGTKETGIDSIVCKIATLQSTGNRWYAAGMFPSQRVHKKVHYSREDDNIFFTSLIVLALQDSKTFLSPKSQAVADSICKKAKANYIKYRGKNQALTYNFWRTNPSGHFPNDTWFSSRKKFMLPDDMDDTSIIYLTDLKSDSTCRLLKQEMTRHTNLSGKRIKNTFNKYKGLKAYSTWFGKKMPIDFDICVQLNVLYFVYQNHLPVNEYDMATIELILRMVEADEHLKYAYYISPHYKNSAIILYHLARLLSHHEVPGLSRIRSGITADIQLLLAKRPSFMERILLSTALLKLGGRPPEIEYPADLEPVFDNFYFFTADLSSSLPDPWKKMLGKGKTSTFYYKSKSYYWTLILEYEICRQSSIK